MQATDTKAASRRFPPFFESFLNDWRGSIAHAFFFEGAGSGDYVAESQSTSEWLSNKFVSAGIGVVAVYSIDRGIRFPAVAENQMRAKFDKILGLDKRPAAAPANDAAALLNAARTAAAGGAQGPSGPPPLPSSPRECIEMLLRLCKEADAQDVAVIIERTDLLVPPADKATMPDPRLAVLGMLHRAGTDPDLEAKGNPIIMLAPSLEEVHPDLRAASSGIRAIEIPLPDYEQRLEFIQERLALNELRIAKAREEDVVGPPRYELGMTPEDLAAMTAGLYRRHVEDIFLRAKAEAVLEEIQTAVVTRELVKQRKKEILASEYADVLAEIELDHTLDQVGGHDSQKKYLRESVVQPLLSGWLDAAPKGLLFTGPAGTGKTFTAGGLAAELSGWNCIELRPENIRGMWQGETEKKFAKARQGIIGFAPVVVIVDEAETKFRRGEGTNTAEENLMGGMLELMGDPRLRGRVLWVMCANWPNRMDAAFIRPGRLDVKLPFLPPGSPMERVSTMAAVLRRLGRPVPAGDDMLAIGRATDKWTQAELERAVVKANLLVRIDPSLDFVAALRRAVGSLRPATKDVELMTMLAIQACDDTDLLPEEYRRQAASPEGVEERITQIRARERTTRDLNFDRDN